MTATRGPICETRAVLPASLEAMDRFVAEFRRSNRDLSTRADAYRNELLLREALANAVVHGCGLDPSKHVFCAWRLRERCLTIAVADEGPGFDWRAAAKRTDGVESGGRGIEILRIYSTRVRFSSRGNAVAILRRF